MARRASSSLKPAVVAGVVAAIAIVAAAGFVVFKKKDSFFKDIPRLHIDEALENANSLRGNEYHVEGKVESRWVRDSGEALSLLVEEGGRTEHLFIMIPNEVEHVNIEREQRYAFKIQFGEGGVAVASAVKRL